MQGCYNDINYIYYILYNGTKLKIFILLGAKIICKISSKSLKPFVKLLFVCLNDHISVALHEVHGVT